MVFVFASTFRSTTFGIWSHCSGVGLRRTAPPVAVRTPWWISSMPAVFSSKNMPLYSFVKTRTSSPRFSKYCWPLIVRRSSWAKTPSVPEPRAIARSKANLVIRAASPPREGLVMVVSVHGRGPDRCRAHVSEAR